MVSGVQVGLRGFGRHGASGWGKSSFQTCYDQVSYRSLPLSPNRSQTGGICRTESSGRTSVAGLMTENFLQSADFANLGKTGIGSWPGFGSGMGHFTIWPARGSACGGLHI